MVKSVMRLLAPRPSHAILFCDLAERALTRLFIDNKYIHYWRCHRRADRSFQVRNRQLHVCARCTGMLAGIMVFPLALFLRPIALPVFAFASVILVMDGLSQMVGWRESNNALRFGSGLGFTTAGLAMLVAYL